MILSLLPTYTYSYIVEINITPKYKSCRSLNASSVQHPCISRIHDKDHAALLTLSILYQIGQKHPLVCSKHSLGSKLYNPPWSGVVRLTGSGEADGNRLYAVLDSAESCGLMNNGEDLPV